MLKVKLQLTFKEFFKLVLQLKYQEILMYMIRNTCILCICFLFVFLGGGVGTIRHELKC